MSRRPLRAVLLSLSYPPDPGGGGVQLSQLAARLAGRDVAVQVLAPSSSPGPTTTGVGGPAPPPGVSVERLGVPEGGGARARLLGLRAASWLLRNRSWDVLHVSGFFPVIAPAVAVARMLGRPVLIKVTELPPGETFRDARSLLARVGLSVLRGSDRIVAVSQAIAETLLAAGVPEERIAEIANGVDSDRFRPATDEERARLRAELSWPLDAPVVLCCGVLSRRKNAIAVVRALGHVGAEAVTLVLAGPDDPELSYRRELEAAVSRLPRAVRVEWTGRLDAEELSRVMRGADVLALTSRFEGLPNVLLEALASGLACVATDIPGCRDALEDGAGVLVPEDDDDALAEVLGRLLTDAEERRALAAEGCRRAREQYSFERVADRYRAVYDELVPEDR